MIRKNRFKVMLCVVLSLLMLVDYTLFIPIAAHAKLDTKSVVVGAVAGAGLALAVPAIGGAIASAGGIAGVGSAIVGGVAAAAGGVAGAVGAMGGAIASVFGAVGGWIAGIIASPMFIPALIIVAVAVGGYFLYKSYKDKKAEKAGDDEVFAGEDMIYVTPGDYEVGGVIPSGDAYAPITMGDDNDIILTIEDGDEVLISDVPPSIVATQSRTIETSVVVLGGLPTSSDGIKASHDRYISAYQKYTSMVTNGGSEPDEVSRALSEYRDAYNNYQTLKNSGIK